MSEAGSIVFVGLFVGFPIKGISIPATGQASTATVFRSTHAPVSGVHFEFPWRRTSQTLGNWNANYRAKERVG
jgi:hypothetical protein